MADWTLNEKVILITGGARGIGAGTGAELARRGAKVVLADLDVDALADTAARITPTPMTIELDVVDMVACEAAVQQVVSEYGRLDVAWANAGIASFGPLALTAPSAFRLTIEVNLLGPYNTLRAALPAVCERRGYLAVTASLASFAHAPGLSAYAATKAGVEAMCNSLRNEVAHLGVDVATIHPSWIDTDMVREGDDTQRSFLRLRESMKEPFKRTFPLERAVSDIVAGFEGRKRRICSPRFVVLAHWLRPLLATAAFERDQRRAAPEITRLFEEELAERGAEAASTSERVGEQLKTHQPSGIS
jgi:NAD(P)-dependent dehydrogenase (short-subunit alcohol dehydrogenase family)